MPADCMKNRRIEIIAGVVLVTTVLTFAQTKPAVELEGAIAKEEVTGDMKAAIAAYQKIAAESYAPPDVRARALLHLAGCYDKIGQHQSRRVYEQIVRDFADQPSAAQARARLAVLNQRDPSSSQVSMTQHQIKLPYENVGPGDTDGHRIVYFDQEKKELIYLDLATTRRRTIITAKTDDPLGFSPSRDFSKVFLHFYFPDKPLLAVVNTDGSNYHQLPSLSIVVGCWMWSWDSRYLLLCGQSHDGVSHLLTVSVDNGRVHELVSLKSGLVTAAAFSPDGRSVAYKIGPSVAGGASRLFIIPAGGGDSQQIYEEMPLPAENGADPVRLLDWSADGRYLAISSRRTGRGALHLLPISDGRSAGAPIFVQYGDVEVGVTTIGGGLIYQTPQPENYWSVYLLFLDENGHPGNWKRLNQPPGGEDYPAPSWSADSNQIVYVLSNGESGNIVRSVHVYDVLSGIDREIYHHTNYLPCVWGAQQTRLFCCAVQHGQETKIVSLSTQSGDIQPLYTFSDSAFSYRVEYADDDDQALFVRKWDSRGWMMLRFEVNTKRLTELESGQHSEMYPIALHQQWLARKNEQAVEVRPRLGGSWRVLLSASKDFSAPSGWVLSPDGRWMIFRDLDSSGKQSLFRVNIASGVQERLGEVPTAGKSGSLRLSPDGRKIVWTSADFSHNYLWLLENFVPSATKR